MGNDLIKMISKDDISSNLRVTSKNFINMPNTHHYTFSYYNKMTGYASIFVDDKREKIDSFMFYPLDHIPELRGNGIGQAAYFLLLEEAVMKMHVAPFYEIERKIINMSESSRKMLSKMGIFDDSQKYPEDAVFVTEVATLLAMTQEFLRKNGYDVDALVSNGISPDFV